MSGSCELVKMSDVWVNHAKIVVLHYKIFNTRHFKFRWRISLILLPFESIGKFTD